MDELTEIKPGKFGWRFPDIAHFKFNFIRPLFGVENISVGSSTNEAPLVVRDFDMGALGESNSFSRFQGSLRGFASVPGGIGHQDQLPDENSNLNCSNKHKQEGEISQPIGISGQFLSLIGSFFFRLERLLLYLNLFCLMFIGYASLGLAYCGAQFIDRGRKFVGIGLRVLAFIILLDDFAVAGLESPVLFGGR